ncbi:ABC transporter permease [Ferrimonas gelatinilytica]|uniref:Phosphonate ABC transporter, permease protein PhnE n=1 Tax=Ferrimonas gelatinilytica TaxID=1255257 RepID=A0ABP9S3P1_9GAMM
MIPRLRQHPFFTTLLLLGLIAALGGDWQWSATDPAAELGRVFEGLLKPDFFATEFLFDALLTTVSIAILGIALGLALALGLVPLYRYAPVRLLCTAVRAVHELFWALLFLQLFGLSSQTALLALALPYGATFARVFSGILAQAPSSIALALPAGSSPLTRLIYGQILPVWPALLSYTRYRFECALRASAVLGFVGLPTLGFHLETAFRQGHYAQGGALLWLFLLLIGSQKWWLNRFSLVPLFVASLLWLPWQWHPDLTWARQFLGQEIWPQLQYTQGSWLLWVKSLAQQALPGLWATLMMAFMALMLSGLIAVLAWPLGTGRLWPSLGPIKGVWLGRGALLVGRSLPELLLAFILLLVFGPSMLPAAVALAIHNGSLIAHLVSQRADSLPLRADCGRSPAHWLYEYLPRLGPGIADLLTYRFEIMLRETAMLGMLGVASLGFYVDSAFELFQFDLAFGLILVTALLNILVAALCRRLVRTQ